MLVLCHAHKHESMLKSTQHVCCVHLYVMHFDSVHLYVMHLDYLEERALHHIETDAIVIICCGAVGMQCSLHRESRSAHLLHTIDLLTMAMQRALCASTALTSHHKTKGEMYAKQCAPR